MSRPRFSRIAPYLLMMVGAGGYIINSFKGEIIDQIKINELKKEVVTEEEYQVEESENKEEIVDNNSTESILEENIEEVDEILEEEIPQEVEFISDELLRSGYDFQNIDFEMLKAINEDACGWICIDDTNIDFPILQGVDNDYYLHHDIEGEKSSSGSIFVDSRNSSLDNPMYDLSDVTLIYGHHKKGGKMFANLCKYTNQSFYEEHPFGIIYTPDGYAYKVTFFASIIISGESDEDIFINDFADEEAFNSYIENLIKNSTFESNVDVEYGDKIIGLITCEYTQGSNSRQVVFAVLDKQYTNELQISENVSQSVTLNR